MTDFETRTQLACAYRILAELGLDDWTYTHLSARALGEDAFFIHPFGLLFEEVTPECLLKVSFDGKVLEGREETYNATGYVIHGQIYQHRPDLNAIFHLHTVAGVAVSAMERGLLPISQFALHFYDQVAYHAYNSLVLDAGSQGSQLVQDLGDKRVMFLENHGTLTCGATIAEAFFYTRHLENACRVQCEILNSGQPYKEIPKEVCEKSVKDLLTFEKNLGERDWKAACRKVGVSTIKVAA